MADQWIQEMCSPAWWLRCASCDSSRKPYVPCVPCLPCLLQVEGGWRINGYKRWIGNSTFADVIVVFARNVTTNEING